MRRALGLSLLAILSGSSIKAGYGPDLTAAVTGVIVGAVAVGAGATYLILHGRGVETGCVVQSAGKKTFVTGRKESYTLTPGGANISLAAGERFKLRGHKSGSAPDRVLTVKAVLRDYGPCPT